MKKQFKILLMKLLKIFFIIWFISLDFSYAVQKWALEPIGRFDIDLNIPELGGLSAIEMHQNGKNFVTISDKGQYFQGNIVRNSTGEIIDLKIYKSGTLLNSLGEPLSGRNTDSESLTTTKNEGFYISFESNHRVMFHRSLSSAATFLPRHKDFKEFSSNKGLEALAANSSGEIFAIPEEPLKDQNDFPIYKLLGENWSIFDHFPTSGTFLVTDAVFLPDNDLLILERDYDWNSGFKMQLRILNLGKNTITGQTVLLRLNSGLHNHEGLSIWQDESKNFFITSISDNNFLPFVSSEIREFRLKNLE